IEDAWLFGVVEDRMVRHQDAKRIVVWVKWILPAAAITMIGEHSFECLEFVVTQPPISVGKERIFHEGEKIGAGVFHLPGIVVTPGKRTLLGLFFPICGISTAKLLIFLAQFLK